ncbi:MAG TPA: hypothetical protein VHC49_17335 [Mycobacteriales bacterium]|nr:hypothetical protein [Mycobacteriales bacterium]
MSEEETDPRARWRHLPEPVDRDRLVTEVPDRSYREPIITAEEAERNEFLRYGAG